MGSETCAEQRKRIPVWLWPIPDDMPPATSATVHVDADASTTEDGSDDDDEQFEAAELAEMGELDALTPGLRERLRQQGYLTRGEIRKAKA